MSAISAMRAARPATRSAHSAFHFGERFLDADTPRLGFLPGYDPANPLIACKWRDVVPERQHFRHPRDGHSEVVGQFVYGAGGKCDHTRIISK